MAEAQLVKRPAPGETCPVCDLVQPLPNALTRAEKAIVEYVATHPEQSQASVGRALDLHKQTVCNALSKPNVQSMILERKAQRSDKALGIGEKAKQLLHAGLEDTAAWPAEKKLAAADKLASILANFTKAGIEIDQGESAELEDGRGMLTRLVAAAYERCEAGLPPPDNPLDLLLGKSESP